jgi:hypothetical protein
MEKKNIFFTFGFREIWVQFENFRDVKQLLRFPCIQSCLTSLENFHTIFCQKFSSWIYLTFNFVLAFSRMMPIWKNCSSVSSMAWPSCLSGILWDIFLIFFLFFLIFMIVFRVSKSSIEYPITRQFSSNRVLGYPTKLLDTRTRVINWKFTNFSHNFRQVFSWKILISKYFLMNIHWKTNFLNFNIRF